MDLFDFEFLWCFGCFVIDGDFGVVFVGWLVFCIFEGDVGGFCIVGV